MNDSDLEKLYEQCLVFADELCNDHSPMAVAGVMTAIALSIYKTGLDESDFNKIVASISQSKDQVKTFTRPVLQ